MLTVSTPIFDGGMKVATMGEVLHNQITFTAELTKIKIDTASQGGVSFGTYTFISRTALKGMIVTDLVPNYGLGQLNPVAGAQSHPEVQNQW